MMFCLFIAGATGTWLAFRTEMDRLINPELRIVTRGPQRVPLSSIVEDIHRRFPGASVHTLILQDREDDSISAYLDSDNGSPLEVDRVFYNPYTGDYLGGSNTRGLVFARANIDALVDRLHYSLWMNTTGLWLMGIVAGVWLATTLAGLALAWPRLWLRVTGWIPVLSARFNRGAYQTNYRLHRASGVWLLPVLAVLAFTAFYQNLPQFVRPVVNAFSPLAVRPAGQPVPPSATVITPDEAIESLSREFPQGHVSSIGFDRRNGRYSMVFRLPGDLSPTGEQWAFVDLASGELVGAKLTATSGAGDRFLTWIFPLHTGTAFGLPGRIVIALSGLCVIGLVVTGGWSWWTRWRMTKRAHRMTKRITVTT
jgi:uncharacterized iron-regulated membrane protein